jgi:hypothetical protein
VGRGDLEIAARAAHCSCRLAAGGCWLAAVEGACDRPAALASRMLAAGRRLAAVPAWLLGRGIPSWLGRAV